MGGGERHVVDLSRGLVERGHEVFAGAAGGAAIRKELPFIPEERLAEFRFNGPMDVTTARAISKLVGERRIDIIHAHVARDYPVAALAARLSRAPFVITRHVLFPMSKLHRILLRGARFVIAPSNAVAASLRSQGIFPDDKIVTVRHGLAARDQLVRRKANEDMFVVGTVGNLDPVKGFDVLIRAAAIVTEKLPHVRFEIAGTDREADSRNELELRELISTLGLNERVELTGWSTDIHQTIAGHDLFVSSSRSESFGYALADAMLAGVPVVATETEGAREVVGDSGPLVPVGSPEALADRILEMITAKGLLEAASVAGRQRIERLFSIDRMIAETEVVYRRAIAGS
jgi:glycosyltransferase involved in cell wall biosynthesis